MLRIWRISGEDLELVISTFPPGSVWVRSVTIDASGQILLGTFGTGYAIFDSDTESWDLDGLGDTSGLNHVSVSGDSLLTVRDAGRVLRDGLEVARLDSPGNFALQWSDLLIAGGHAGALFECGTGNVLHQHHSLLNCAAVMEGGDLLIGTYTGDGICLTRKEGRVELRKLLKLHDQAVKGVASSARSIFSVSASGEVSLHDRVHLNLSHRLPNAHDAIANGVFALPDGRFVTVCRDRRLRLWSGNQVTSLDTPHQHSIKCVTANGDGRWAASGSYDGTIAWLDLRTLAWGPVARPTASGISSLCALPGQDAVAASSFDGQIYRVDAAGQISTLLPRTAHVTERSA